MSILASLPSTSALSFVPSVRITVISFAPSITWLSVITMPAGSMMKPDPSEFERRLCGASSPSSPLWRWSWRLKKSSNSWSSGVPGGSFGAALGACSSVTWAAEMLTTASVTLAARSASESVPLAAAGPTARTGTGIASPMASALRTARVEAPLRRAPRHEVRTGMGSPRVKRGRGEGRPAAERPIIQSRADPAIPVPSRPAASAPVAGARLRRLALPRPSSGPA